MLSVEAFRNLGLRVFFNQHVRKPACLICHDSIGVNKEYNVKRYYETMHARFKKLSGQIRKDEVCKLTQSLQQQSFILTKASTKTERNIHTRYAVSMVVVKDKAFRKRRIRDGILGRSCKHCKPRKKAVIYSHQSF